MVPIKRRSPLGERGLKYAEETPSPSPSPSLSAWRAWIEIKIPAPWIAKVEVALRLESVD